VNDAVGPASSGAKVRTPQLSRDTQINLESDKRGKGMEHRKVHNTISLLFHSLLSYSIRAASAAKAKTS
jgi:hypothetical protein